MHFEDIHRMLSQILSLKYCHLNKLGKHREKTFHTNPPFLSVYTGRGGEGEKDKSFTSVCTTKNILILWFS